MKEAKFNDVIFLIILVDYLFAFQSTSKSKMVVQLYLDLFVTHLKIQRALLFFS